MSDLAKYDYDLPHELIAQEPLRRRPDARLMVVDRAAQTIERSHVRDLPSLLRPGDCLVLNDTRVVPARVVGYRQQTGGRWEGLFLAADTGGVWRLLGKTRGKLRPGEIIRLTDVEGRDALGLQLLDQEPTGAWLARPRADDLQRLGGDSEQAQRARQGDALAILELFGRVPLPHYIRGGQMTESDRERYQTVYASHPGSAAAPTAGLHFTIELLEQLAAAGIGAERVTLHVGLDTFRPIGVERLEEHRMHSEWAQLTGDVAERLREVRSGGRRVVAVGTTSARVLETAARSGQISPWEGATDLFIRPPFAFHAVDALLTNFHLPRSTLLVLVRTFGGDALLRRAYRIAIEEEYRFYSYGDAMLIL